MVCIQSEGRSHTVQGTMGPNRWAARGEESRGAVLSCRKVSDRRALRNEDMQQNL